MNDDLYYYNRLTGTDIVVNEACKGVVEKLNFTCASTQGENLFNGSYTANRYIDANNGSFRTVTAARTSIAIPAIANATYTLLGKYNRNIWRCEDASNNLLGFYDSISIVTPANTAFIYAYYDRTGESSNIQVIQLPNPSAPVPIYSSGDGGYINAWSHKKNMFDGIYTNGFLNGTTGVWTTDSTTRTAIIRVNPSTQYSINKFINTGIGTRFVIAESPTILSSGGITTVLYSNAVTTKQVITTGATAKYLYVYVTNDINSIPYLMVTQNSAIEATYEPYTGSVVPIPLPPDFGRGLPNLVGDTDLLKKVGKVVLNGSEAWTSVAQSSANTDYYYCYTPLLDTLASGSLSNNLKLLCDKLYAVVELLTGNVVSQESIAIVGTSNKLRIMILKSRVDSMAGATLADKFKAWLSTNNVTVYYELATPVDITITKPQIPTYDGINYITTTNNVKPSLTIEAWKR